MAITLGRARALWRRWDPIRVDTVVAAVLLAVAELNVWTARPGYPRVGPAVWALLLAVAVAVRRRWLLQALVAGFAGAAVLLLIGGGRELNGNLGFPGTIFALLLFYSAGAHLEGRASLAGLALGLAISTVSALSSSSLVAANVVWDDVVAGLPWFVGRTLGERAAQARAARERAERLDAEHEYHSRAAALGERARLAREIHDVIAHSVSVMVIQSAGARTVMAREPERADASLRAVERAGREALAEMRRLLGVLGSGADLRALAPQPGLGDLDELMTQTRAAGLAATLRVEGEPVSVSSGLSLCAYRVIQEALTNTIKHAGPGPAQVHLRWDAEALEVEVLDAGARAVAAPTLPAGGHGLTGMRERTALHGGTVHAGPVAGGGFAVRARLPLLERHAA